MRGEGKRRVRIYEAGLAILLSSTSISTSSVVRMSPWRMQACAPQTRQSAPASFSKRQTRSNGGLIRHGLPLHPDESAPIASAQVINGPAAQPAKLRISVHGKIRRSPQTLIKNQQRFLHLAQFSLSIVISLWPQPQGCRLSEFKVAASPPGKRRVVWSSSRMGCLMQKCLQG